MINQAIEKQILLSEPFSDDVLKLARAIYNTYLTNEKELYMSFQLSRMFKLFDFQPSSSSLTKLKDFLFELNEPLVVKNFVDKNEVLPMKFVNFCKYKFTKNTLEIELNEDFLEVENRYMLDSFLTN